MDADFEHLTDAFENCDIDPANFTHICHVGVAFVMLSRYDFLTAAQTYATNINTIATRAGAPDKFHVTITLAFLSVISERMDTGDYENAAAFMAANPDLVEKNPLMQMYSKERITSDRARTAFLLPDKAA